ncbi:arylamine N-acetyltransferase [Staphylococcus simulans]|uniref:arylamine N-acetyltransferase family protein n=1 Tax=Staphylococcus simulans TaxID=1286 RepID=UPI001E374C3A|nr:arylamine N-acetyltransferase [Staphylococcus simulans]MCD8915238.1 arylamine N-acetyltransferase [Staphylococcus simulans]
MVDFTRLERYLGIDTDDHKSADLEALNHYIRQYMLKVPFENINVQNGWPLALTDEAMMQKVVDEQRGGFCYEMNYFFKHYLEYKGFEVDAMSATVMSPNGWAREGSHMSLKVTIDDKAYVADIGFGDMPKFALPMDCPSEGLSDVTGSYRVHGLNEEYYDIEKWSDAQQAWQISYRVLNEPKTLEAFEDGIAYNQYSPDSIFVQGLLITKATETGRNTLTHNHLTLLSNGDKSVQTTTKENYQDCLETYFGIPKMTIATFS